MHAPTGMVGGIGSRYRWSMYLGGVPVAEVVSQAVTTVAPRFRTDGGSDTVRGIMLAVLACMMRCLPA